MKSPKQIIPLLSISLILSGAGLTISNAQENPTNTAVVFEMSESTTVSTKDELMSAIEQGGNIFVKNGEYGNVTIPSGKQVVLQGESKKGVIFGTITATGADVSLSNLTVSTNAYGVYTEGSSSLDIQNCIFKITPNASSNNTGIMTWNWKGDNKNILIKNNTFNMNGMRAIQLRNSTSSVVEGNAFNMANSDGSKSNLYAVLLDNKVTNFTFNNNTINNSRFGVYVHQTTTGTKMNFGTNNFNNTSFDYAVRPQAANDTSNTINGSYGYWFSPSVINDNLNNLSAVKDGATVYMAGTYDVGTLTISKSISLVGEGQDTTIINGKIIASNNEISNLDISNLTINANNQHIALWQNSNVKAVNIDNVTFNHLLSGNQATMYFWGNMYDLISVTDCKFNYPNAGTGVEGTDVVTIDGEKVDRAFVGQTWDANKVVFSNNTINKDAKATIRKGFELSGYVKDFTANNNNFTKTRYAIYAWLFEESTTSKFILNHNKFNNCTTKGITIEGWTGESLGSLKCNTHKNLALINSEVLKGKGNKGNKE